MITIFSDVTELHCTLFGDVNEKVYFSVVNKLSQ
jgi:hypothetical protein